MEVTVEIPDQIAAAIRNGTDDSVSRSLLELAAIQAHEQDMLTEYEVMEMLGFETREELYTFFKRHNIRSTFTAEDLKNDQITLINVLDNK
jgi:arginine repressor